MTLASDISTTSTALSDIKQAIIDKGVTPNGNITTYAAAIANIPTGSKGINYATLLNDCVVTLSERGRISYTSSGYLSGYTNFILEDAICIYPNDKNVYGGGRSFSFTGREYIKTITFGAVDNIFDSYNQMFLGFTQLTDIYFSALKTTSNITFNDLLYNSGTNVIHTLHFPSNLESKIQSSGGYPLFSGTSGYVVCAFDLPATS